MSGESALGMFAVDPWQDNAFVATYERWAEPEGAKLARVALDRSQVAPGGRILDVGTGMGTLAVQAAQRGHPVLAFDSSALMLERAGRRLADYPDCSVVEMNAQEFDLADNSFDAAFAINSVTITPHREASLRDMARVVRPGGIVCVVHWASQRGWPAFGIVVNAIRALDSPPAAIWSMPEIPPFTAAELEDAGCEQVSVEQLEVPATLPAPATFLDDLDGFFSVVVPGYRDLTHSDRAALAQLVERDMAHDTASHGPYTMMCSIGIGRVPG